MEEESQQFLQKRKFALFTNKEMELILKRLKGDRSDRDGIFCRRIKPKMKEILAWHQEPYKKIMIMCIPREVEEIEKL